MASKMDEKVIVRMKADAPLNFDKATAIADAFGLKPKSVVASAIRNGIAYDKKAKVNKAGNPIVAKDDLVEKIAEALEIEVKTLDGLEKASKSSLEALAVVTALLRKMLEEVDAETETESEVNEG